MAVFLATHSAVNQYLVCLFIVVFVVVFVVVFTFQDLQINHKTNKLLDHASSQQHVAAVLV